MSRKELVPADFQVAKCEVSDDLVFPGAKRATVFSSFEADVFLGKIERRLKSDRDIDGSQKQPGRKLIEGTVKGDVIRLKRKALGLSWFFKELKAEVKSEGRGCRVSYSVNINLGARVWTTIWIVFSALVGLAIIFDGINNPFADMIGVVSLALGLGLSGIILSRLATYYECPADADLEDYIRKLAAGIDYEV